MKQFRIELIPSVVQEIESAYLHISEDSPLNAKLWLQGIYQAINTLENHPQRCGTIREQKVFAQPIRELRYQSHRIIFTISEEKSLVKILTVRHAAQDSWKGTPGKSE